MEKDEEFVRVGEPTTPPETFLPVHLEEIDKGLFRGPKKYLWLPMGQRGIFGGQVLGQSLCAAQKTLSQLGATSEIKLSSMHSYFLRAGNDQLDIIYYVEPLRKGRTFSTCIVTAKQNGNAIFVLIASFQRQKDSIPNQIIHQHVMPSVPDPEELPTEQEFYMNLVQDPRCPKAVKPFLKGRADRKNPFDVRRVLSHDTFYPLKPPSDYVFPEYPKYTEERTQMMWMKTKKRLPDDEDVHRSVLAYASDMGLLGTAKGPVRFDQLGMMASLDHSMWFHAPFRMDEWMLYEMESPRVNNERGLAVGKIYRQDGTLAVTVSQEGLIRLRETSKL